LERRCEALQQERLGERISSKRNSDRFRAWYTFYQDLTEEEQELTRRKNACVVCYLK